MTGKIVLRIVVIWLVLVVLSASAVAANSNSFPRTKNASFPNIFRKIKNVGKRIFGKKPVVPDCPVPKVERLDLIAPESALLCGEGDLCIDKPTKITVKVTVGDYPPELLVFRYKVSAGEIVGTGDNVVWDLSKQPPGGYKITAWVDDGCGECGGEITKTIVIKECPECKR